VINGQAKPNAPVAVPAQSVATPAAVPATIPSKK